MWRNNGNGTFTEVAVRLIFKDGLPSLGAVGTDWNNDRAVDLVVTEALEPLTIFENPREGKFLNRQFWPAKALGTFVGVAVLDFNHDGWMDLAFTHWGAPA